VVLGINKGSQVVRRIEIDQVLVDHTEILATWDAEIGKIDIQGQPGQIVCETLPSPK
jgi:hypothetical protein